MAKRALSAGVTSRIENVWIQDSASAVGAGKTGLVWNTAGWKAYYVRPGAAAVSIALATQTVTGGFSGGGIVEIDATNMPGLYRFDVPDAVFAAGVDHAIVMLSGPTGVAPVVMEYDLTNPTNFTSLSIDSSGRTTPIPAESLLVRSSTAQAGAAGSITLDASASATTDLYAGLVLRIISGTGAGQSRVITAYNGGTKVATVDGAWAVTPDNTSVFAVLAIDAATRTISNKLGAWTGTGLNTVLGALRALANKAASLTPTDISSGGTFDNTTDSLEAQSDGAAFTATIKNAIADSLLDRALNAGAGAAADTGRTVRNALRRLRNKVSASSTTLSVTQEDDSTAAWSATLTTDAAAVPIIVVDPA